MHINIGMRKKFQSALPPDFINRDAWSFTQLNSDNFRGPELDTVDWNNSIVAFGCSFCFGTGLKDNEVYTYLIQEILGIPVINMGSPATSMTFALLNQLTLHELGYKPKAIINLWTSPARQTYFVRGRQRNLGPWLNENPVEGLMEKLKHTYNNWNRHKSNTANHAFINQRIAEALWCDTIHLQYTSFKDNEFSDSIPYLETIDNSPLGHHPGPETHIEWANLISKELINSNIS